MLFSHPPSPIQRGTSRLSGGPMRTNPVPAELAHLAHTMRHPGALPREATEQLLGGGPDQPQERVIFGACPVNVCQLVPPQTVSHCAAPGPRALRWITSRAPTPSPARETVGPRSVAHPDIASALALPPAVIVGPRPDAAVADGPAPPVVLPVQVLNVPVGAPAPAADLPAPHAGEVDIVAEMDAAFELDVLAPLLEMAGWVDDLPGPAEAGCCVCLDAGRARVPFSAHSSRVCCHSAPPATGRRHDSTALRR